MCVCVCVCVCVRVCVCACACVRVWHVCKRHILLIDSRIGVGCTTINDTFCIRTNWGKCVDVLAPVSGDTYNY